MTPSKNTSSIGTLTRTKDYNDEVVNIYFSPFHETIIENFCNFSQARDSHDMHHNIINNNTRRSKSKSTEEMNVGKC